VQVGADTMFVGVDRTVVHVPVSPEANPLPDIVTVVPAGPVFGESVSVGLEALTISIAVAKSPALAPPLPVTVTTYIPGVAVLAMVKLLLVNVP